MGSPEQNYARLLTGSDRPSILMTDGYKFAMGQAGFPLRQETFYLAFRKGGPHYVPFDFEGVVEALVHPVRHDEDAAKFLVRHGYELTAAMTQVWDRPMTTWAPPAGSWVGNYEPMVTVTGPSFLVSWLEPLVIMFRYVVQVASVMMNGTAHFSCTCEQEADIVKLVAESIGKPCTTDTDRLDYQHAVRTNVASIKEVLHGDMHRAFEVGMRGASCMQMHEAALLVCHEQGLTRTSNVYWASKLGMTPVGTAGHEHQQRWMTDEAGFRALRDIRPGAPSYLFDTFGTMRSGIPAAIMVMREDLTRSCAVRFDSGDQIDQLQRFLTAEHDFAVKPHYIFEDGYTAVRTHDMEALLLGVTRDEMPDMGKVSKERIGYGYGGFIVNPEGAVQFRRDDVQAVYKLSKTGTVPVMKTCGSKSSLPGVPVVLARNDGAHIVAQRGEEVGGFHPLTASDPKPKPLTHPLSVQTRELVKTCNARFVSYLYGVDGPYKEKRCQY